MSENGKDNVLLDILRTLQEQATTGDTRHLQTIAALQGIREDIQALTGRFDNLLRLTSKEVGELRTLVTDLDKRLRALEGAK